MRKLTAIAAALALTGLAACDSIQPGAAAPTAVPTPQQGGTGSGAGLNPALLPASAFQGNVAGGGGAVQQQGGTDRTAVNPANVPAARLQGGSPSAGVGQQQGGTGPNAINPANVPANRFPTNAPR